MSAGLPVVTSNRSALKEVAGDAGLLVDPLDVDALRGALQAALEDKGAREGLIAAGFRRAAAFTWQLAARETLAVYQS
jgi:alpha-1,3-rhamnosyl/mannosyltransferase